MKDATAEPPSLEPPGALLLLLEARAPLELAAALAASPWLRRADGDGHPVLVYPGLVAHDVTTALLRSFLRQRGYVPYAWEQGWNLGPRAGVLESARARLQQIAARHGSTVSLVGWSLGGVYAREMAKLEPALARCVVTLGTPFSGHPRATNAWRIYELVSGQKVDGHALADTLAALPPCPTTSIYSKSDGIVAWRCSLNPDTPLSENIEVHSSHTGMGFNPLALYALADRLAQDPRHWRKFDLQGARRWFYRAAA